MKPRKKVLFICPYPRGLQAGQRFKYEQYFNLFDSLTKSLGIQTVYLLTPKSKFYEIGIIKDGLDKKMDAILYTLLANNAMYT